MKIGQKVLVVRCVCDRCRLYKNPCLWSRRYLFRVGVVAYIAHETEEGRAHLTVQVGGGFGITCMSNEVVPVEEEVSDD